MKYFIHLPMKMEPTVSSEMSAIRNHTPGNYLKRNKLDLEHGESLKTRILQISAQLLENKAQSASLQKFEPCSSQMQVRSYRASANILATTPYFVCTDEYNIVFSIRHEVSIAFLVSSH